MDLSLNSVSAATKYYELGRYFDELMPEQRINTLYVPGRDGLSQINKTFKPKTITGTGILYANNQAQLLTRLSSFADFLYYDEDKQLIFDDKSSYYYNAQFVGKVPVARKASFVPIKLKFLCNDPFLYAVTEDDIDETGIVVNGTTFTVNNGGHYLVWPTITITFNQNQTHVYIENNTITDNIFDISKAFVTNDVLTINSKTGVINLNGSYSPAGIGDGGNSKAEYTKLATGANQLMVGTDDATIDIDVNVTFNKAYFY